MCRHMVSKPLVMPRYCSITWMSVSLAAPEHEAATLPSAPGHATLPAELAWAFEWMAVLALVTVSDVPLGEKIVPSNGNFKAFCGSWKLLSLQKATEGVTLETQLVSSSTVDLDALESGTGSCFEESDEVTVVWRDCVWNETSFPWVTPSLEKRKKSHEKWGKHTNYYFKFCVFRQQECYSNKNFHKPWRP